MFSPLQYFLLFNRHDGYGFDRAGVLACAAADTFICVNQRKTAVFFAYCSPGAFHDTEAAFDAGVFIDDGQADLCFLLLVLLRVLSVPAVEHIKCVRVRCGISLRAPPVVH